MPVRVVSLPGGDDPDSFLRTKGAAEFQRLLDGAESIVCFQCRLEQAKERDPKSIDAVSRISKAVLATIAACPGPVLRATMVDEAARLLGLPAAALAEELGKVKLQPAMQPVATQPEEEDRFVEPAGDEQPVAGEDAGDAAPPPAREMALMEFLLVNERESALDAMLGEFLPRKVFLHDFTWRFIEAWRANAVDDGDAIAELAGGLSGRESAWFDSLMLSAGRANAGGRSATDIMQEFVRGLWRDYLLRRRGDLPAAGDAEADMERLEISHALKRIDLARWHDVKDIVRRLIMKG
jgi:DNA primase